MNPANAKAPAPKPIDMRKPMPAARVTASALGKSLRSSLPKADRKAFDEFMRRMKGDR
jgi:hypothetical protein